MLLSRKLSPTSVFCEVFNKLALPVLRKVINFATMINITAFTIGVTTTFFAVFAIYILFWRKDCSRFQTIIGCIMAVWCLWNLKDLVLTFPGMYRDEVLNWLLIVDGWSALTYMVLIFEVVIPGWITWSRLLLSAMPFAAFTAAYALWPCQMVIYAYVGFLWCFAWGIVIFGYIRMKNKLTYLLDNYSNIDKTNVSWLRPVFFFSILGQLLWLAISFWASPVGDIVYYVMTIVLWLIVLYYSWDFQPIAITSEPVETPADDPAAIGETSPSEAKKQLPNGRLETLMEEQKYYLKPTLTLNELAQELNTNRTYISSYLNRQMNMTFYDYINKLRIERAAIPLMREHPEYKLEFVASQSGFASISTFRRLAS